jgi:hypothetical protein
MSSGDAGSESGRGQRSEREPDKEQNPDREPEDNVVRLPRDWLGPREKLVPFGPSARHDEEEPLDEIETRLSPSVSADDFWGERSAALQDPLEEGDEDAVSLGSVRNARWRLDRLRRPIVPAAIAAGMALAVGGYFALGYSGTNQSSRIASRPNPAHQNTIWPWSFPKHQTPGRRVGRSAPTHHASRTSHRANGSAAVPVDYASQGSTPASSGSPSGYAPASSSSAPTGSSGIPATPVGTGTSTTPSSTPPPASATRPRSRTPAFGARGALAPGSSPTG